MRDRLQRSGAEADQTERLASPSRRTRARAAWLVTLATTLIATSAHADPDAPPPSTPPAHAEPFAVSSSSLSDSCRLVVAPRDEALSLSVCVAPVRGPEDPELALAIAKRGGDASQVVADGVSVFCAALPTTELPFALWLAARVLETENGARDGANNDGAADPPSSAQDPGLARAEAIALEGAIDEDQSRATRFVVTLAGLVDASEAERLAPLQFDVHESSSPASRTNPWHPQQTSERTSTMESDVASPRARYTWITPQGSEDEAAVRVALEVLGGGDEARLPRLFRATHLGKRAEAWERHLPGGTLSGLLIEPSTRVSIDRIRRFVDGALKQLRLVGPSRRELARARQRLLLDAYRTWGDPVALGRLLSAYELVRGGAERASSALTAVQRITARDVSRAVQRALVDARRTTVELYPPAFPPDDPRVAGQKLYTVLPGDTLASLAERFHVTLAGLARANDLDPKYALTDGQPLWIPSQ
jgi:LysM repeat protein